MVTLCIFRNCLKVGTKLKLVFKYTNVLKNGSNAYVMLFFVVLLYFTLFWLLNYKCVCSGEYNLFFKSQTVFLFLIIVCFRRTSVASSDALCPVWLMSKSSCLQWSLPSLQFILFLSLIIHTFFVNNKRFSTF